MPAELYSLRSTRKTWTHKEVHKTWATRWMAEKRGRTSYRYTPKPTKKVLRLHDGLSKRQSALLVQLRTEKIGLRDFLCQTPRTPIAHAGKDAKRHRTACCDAASIDNSSARNQAPFQGDTTSGTY